MAKNQDIPVNLSIVKLLDNVFGIKPTFEPNIETLPARAEANSKGTNYYSVDKFGREVFLPIQLDYVDEKGTDKAIELQHAVISISGANKFESTELTAQTGPFDEFINNGDWKLTIRGFLISETNDLPEDDIAQLAEVKKAAAVTIYNALTDLVLWDSTGGSNTCIVESLEFPEVVGVQNVKPFVLMLKSTRTFNLYEI